jgi:23S rRNA (guanine745-N1)-methyltransferase
MDVSKDALKMAARAHLKCQFVLANVHQQIPLLYNSTTLITAVCAPRNFNEFSRILTSNGSLVLVIPTPRHLNQLRSFTKLLAIEEEKEQQIIEIASEFKLVERIEVEHTQELTHTTLKAVMTMTPNFWHKEQEMLFPKNLLVTFSFRILVFELSARLSLYSSD